MRFVYALTVLALSACGGSAVQAPRPVSASAVATIEPTGGVLQFPSADGYGGSFVYFLKRCPSRHDRETGDDNRERPEPSGAAAPGHNSRLL